MKSRLTECILLASLLAGLVAAPIAAGVFRPKKIVLIAGKKSHGPEGNRIHDYAWSVRLLKVMLGNSNVKNRVKAEFHVDGWPKDQSTLEDADTIMVISDGRDGDQYSEAPFLENEERLAFVARQIKRGCGLMTFHFSTFASDKYADEVLSWTGGYFKWETDGKRHWYSAITTMDAKVRLGSPDHPVPRGIQPFKISEEFYYNIRFNLEDKALKPILIVPDLPGREPDGRVVAWARQREDGRGASTQLAGITTTTGRTTTSTN